MGTDDEEIQKIIDDLLCVYSSLYSQASRVVAETKYEFAQLSLIQTAIDNLQCELSQGEVLRNNSEAFRRAREVVRRACAESPDGSLKIMILAVSSSLSWPFIRDFLVETLKKHPEFSVNVDWLLVHPASLRNAGTTGAGKPWHELSAMREEQLQILKKGFSSSLRSRLVVNLSYFKNLPHWHGVLLNDTELLLGRASWEWKKEIPNLRVGEENEYRIYNLGSPHNGEKRIQLFQNWFKYYKFCSVPITEK